jgi:hypothetical protein
MDKVEGATRQLAVIKRVKLGIGDNGEVTLRFDAYVNEYRSALQVLGKDEAWSLIGSAGSFGNLAARVCWVKSDGNMIIYDGPWEG